MIRFLTILVIVVAALVAVPPASAQCGPAGCGFRGAVKAPVRVVRRAGGMVRKILPRNR